MKIISCETKSTSKYFPIYLRSIYFSIHLLWFQCALKVSFFGPDQKIVFFGFWSKTSFQVRSKARNPDSLLKAGCFRMTEEMLKRPPRCLGLIRRNAISRYVLVFTVLFTVYKDLYHILIHPLIQLCFLGKCLAFTTSISR